LLEHDEGDERVNEWHEEKGKKVHPPGKSVAGDLEPDLLN
jgi:hypothetical protein